MILNKSFYNQNTIQVAKDLLGCFLVRKYKGKIIKAMITETEAYRGYHDLASHAARGKTERNKIMYEEAGRVYIYLVYGMHYMLNIVTEEKEYPAAVLIRAVEIVETQNLVETQNFASLRKRLNGPAKLTKCLRIDKSLNGHDLTKGEKLWIEKSLGHPMSKWRIIKSPRVGVDYAKHCKEWKWNFAISTNYESR